MVSVGQRIENEGYIIIISLRGEAKREKEKRVHLWFRPVGQSRDLPFMGLTVTNFFEQKEINKNAIAVDRFLECTNLKYDDDYFIAIGEVEIKMLHKKKKVT